MNAHRFYSKSRNQNTTEIADLNDSTQCAHSLVLPGGEHISLKGNKKQYPVVILQILHLPVIDVIAVCVNDKESRKLSSLINFILRILFISIFLLSCDNRSLLSLPLLGGWLKVVVLSHVNRCSVPSEWHFLAILNKCSLVENPGGNAPPFCHCMMIYQATIG